MTPLSVAVVVTAVYGLYVLWRLGGTGGDPSFLILAGPPATNPHTTLPNVHVFSDGTTYDGQFFYRLALEPWTGAQTRFGVQLDLPAYRQQRILYPLVAWIISAGMWQLTPTALILGNLLAVGALAYGAALFATTLGRHVFASVLVPFYPGYLVTISRDLAELTEAALLVAGLVLLARQRFWLAAAVLTAAMLARETLLVVPIAGVVVWTVRLAQRERDRRPPLGVWLTPLLAFAVWSAVMALRWGTTGVGQGAVNFGLPLAGLVEHVQALEVGTRWRANLVELGLFGLILGGLAAVGVAYGRRLFGSYLALACVVYAVLGVLYAGYVWQDDHSYLRALHELFLTACLALLAANVWYTRVLAPVTVVGWLAFLLQSGRAP